MKVKIVRETGVAPSGPGLWYGPLEEALVLEIHGSMLQMDEGKVLNGEEERLYSYYAQDLLRWRDMTPAEWLKSVWGQVAPNTAPVAWVGIVLDTSPEFNEFGEVSP